MLKSTKKYIYFLIFLTCIEFIFSIPFLVDFLLTKEKLIFITFIPVFLHIFGYVYTALGYSEVKIKGYHSLGIATVITNMIFPVGFVPHIILFIIGAVKLKKLSREEKRKDELRLQEDLILNEYEIKSKIENQLNEYDEINIDNADEYFK